jgi:hypothetical protein
LKAERDRIDGMIESWEARRERVASAAVRAGAVESNLRRSRMNAGEKAAFIGEHGSAEYFAIPWD